MKKLIPFLVALILPVYVFGAEHLIPELEASCKCDGYAFKINFSSLSGDPTEVRLEREWLKNTGTDSAENLIEDWMYIQVIKDKIMNKWSK